MHKGLYKYRQVVSHRAIKKILPALFEIVLMVAAVFFGYRFIGSGGVASQNVELRSAAPEKESEQIKKYSAEIEAEKFGGYAYKGQKDVTMMRFKVGVTRAVTDAFAGTDNPPKIRKITFAAGGYSGTADLVSLQLYLDKKMIGLAPLAGGRAVFGDMAIQFNGGTKLDFEVKANVGENAAAGNRAEIEISKSDDIEISDGELNRYPVAGNFPIQSGYFTIVGDRIR